jgi:lantibiotic biosynthesis protein
LNNKPYNYPSRLAWCYGDLGVGYAILKAGILTSNKNYVKYGEKILINLTNKTIQDEKTGVKDAGFCHGSAGIAHLFNKVFQYSNNERFYKASKYWMEVALKMQNSDGSYSRCHYLDKEEKWQYVKDNGLIEGASGIGLSMLSYLEPNELSWDLCFLL